MGELDFDLVHSVRLKSVALSVSSQFVDPAMHPVMMWVVNFNFPIVIDSSNWLRCSVRGDRRVQSDRAQSRMLSR